MTDVTKIAADIQAAFEEFKTANDARLAQIEAKGSADALTTEKVDRINATIGELQTKFAELEKKAGRPGAADLSNDLERKAFDAFARRGDETELKAMSLTGADGGHAVPTVIDQMITDRMLNISAVRSVATVKTISTSNYTHLVNRRGTTSGWAADTGTRSATDTSTLQQIIVPMGELYARPTTTQALLDDAQFNVEEFIANEAAAEFAVEEGAAFVSGNGTNKPKGFLSYTTALTKDADRAAGELQHFLSGVASALPTNHDVFLDMVYGLKPQHRNGAVWMASAATLASLRKIKDSDGNYLWQPAVMAGQPSTFLGYAVVEAEDMPTVEADALSVAFGNFRNGYLIVDRVGVRTLRDPYSTKGFVEFYTWKRVGGCVTDSEAIKLLKISPAA